MSTLTKKILLGGLAALVIVLVPIGAIAGWGPSRPTKVYSDGVAGFDHVVFDSFTNTPVYGNEPQFLSVKPTTDTSNGGFNTQMTVTPGQEIWVRAYVHNNADSSLNASGKGIAHGTNLKITLPTATANNLRINAFINAANASPATIAADSTVVGANGQPIALAYAGSAVAYTNAVPTGYKVADSVVTTGAPIGYTGPNGDIPGCFQYDMTVMVKVKVESPALTITKQIAEVGQPWAKSITANQGDKLSYLLTYTNKGTVDENNVTVHDILPPGVTVVPGSVQLFNGNFPNGKAVPDGALFTTGGVIAGNYHPGLDGYFKFKVTVDNTYKPGTTAVTNTACVKSDEIQAESCDTAQFHVTIGTPPTTPPPSTPPSTPPTTTTLPQTGATDIALGGLTGSTGLGYGITMLRKSKKNLRDALRNIVK